MTAPDPYQALLTQRTDMYPNNLARFGAAIVYTVIRWWYKRRCC